MAKEPQKNPRPAIDKTGEFFSVGTALHAVRPSYIRRPADESLFETVVAGHYAHIVAPDRSGKTSLISSTSARLQNNGYRVAVLDLEQIGMRDGGSNAGRWYYSIAYRLSRQLRLKTDLQAWWQDHAILSNRQRLVEFLTQLVLQNVPESVVIFVDEIQVVADLPFAEHLLAAIRAAHDSRTTEPAFERLSFVMIGECDPFGLVQDQKLSPFGISTSISLDDFSRNDFDLFVTELGIPPADAERALDRIYHWTSGQPYLSQKLARAVSREDVKDNLTENIDRIAMQQLAGRAALSSEPHLGHLHRAVMADKKNYEALLTTYGKIRKGISVQYNPESDRHRQLRAIGLVVVDDDGKFKVRNRVYQSVFTARWANENLPLHWRGPAIAALIILALTAIPFAYTQLLPKPYLRAMANATYDLETVADAYSNLRSFPGHVVAADRMFQSVLENRARQANERTDIREIARFAVLLPDGTTLADKMIADFWDRSGASAMHHERRDDALIASLEALVVSTQERRRRVASLIGDDYSELIATLPPQGSDGLVFNAENVQLTYHEGARISQWVSSDGQVEAREPWTMSALEVTPLLRRVIVNREGTANRIGLTVNVSHPRLDDLRMKLIAPSGRTAELTFSQTSSAANEDISIDRRQLASLNGESLNGTWSLSLRDESTGVSGHLMGWNLSLNSQVVVENFERGLDIPDPVERASENVWFSPDGRYAIARALQSDSARLWDLNFAQAARTIAVPASERVLGLSAGAEFLVTVTPNSLNLWRTSDGRMISTLELGTSVTGAILSADGEHVLVSHQRDPDTLFEVWSLGQGKIVGELTVAGVPVLTAMDATASRLAVADYDRAVRIWNLRSGRLVAQIGLESQPSGISLSANGETLGAVAGEQGVSLWRLDQPGRPVVHDVGRGEWLMGFSPSGALFVAGNHREGMQAYRSTDGIPVGPLLDPGLRPGGSKVLAFSDDESQLITAGSGDIARFWRMPAVSAEAPQSQNSELSTDQSLPQESGIVVSAIAPGGERVAFGDRAGHVHIEQIDAVAGNQDEASEEINFLGHQGAVRSMVFSQDGALIASAGVDGTIRLWDAHSGLPRPFYGRASVSAVERLAFSPSANTLAVLGGQHVWLMNTETGEELAGVELGEYHADLGFVNDEQLFLGGKSGTVRSFYADRTGSWHVRNVWQGPAAIEHLEVATSRKKIVLVDALQQVRLIDAVDGNISDEVIQLPNTASAVAFSPNESRVLFKTGLWLHRALVSPAGLIRSDSIRAPKSLAGSGIAFDNASQSDGSGNSNLSGDRVLLLVRESGQSKLTELYFSYSSGPGLFGSQSSLLGQWTERLRGVAPNDFVREGF